MSRPALFAPFLSTSVAFVALSEQAEYAYAWLPALTAALGFARPKAASAAVSEDVVAWMNGSLGKRRQGRESGDGDRRDHLNSQDFPETRPEEWAIDRD